MQYHYHDIILTQLDLKPFLKVAIQLFIVCMLPHDPFLLLSAYCYTPFSSSFFNFTVTDHGFSAACVQEYGTAKNITHHVICIRLKWPHKGQYSFQKRRRFKTLLLAIKVLLKHLIGKRWVLLDDGVHASCYNMKK